MESQPITKPGAKLINISAGDLFSKSNYQDFGRYVEVDLAIAAMPKPRCRVDRSMKQADHARSQGAPSSSAAPSSPKPIGASAIANRELAAVAWDASPITTARMAAELWNQMKDEDWSLVSD